jgi:hypothetical protein
VSVASPLPLLAQEVLQLVHELLRVKVILTPWVRRLGTRRRLSGIDPFPNATTIVGMLDGGSP